MANSFDEKTQNHILEVEHFGPHAKIQALSLGSPYGRDVGFQGERGRSSPFTQNLETHPKLEAHQNLTTNRISETSSNTLKREVLIEAFVFKLRSNHLTRVSLCFLMSMASP